MWLTTTRLDGTDTEHSRHTESPYGLLWRGLHSPVCFLGWEDVKTGLHWNVGSLYLAWVLTDGNHIPREWPKSKASSALYLEVTRQRHFCPVLVGYTCAIPANPGSRGGGSDSF